jgi:hypothetical protein
MAAAPAFVREIMGDAQLVQTLQASQKQTLDTPTQEPRDTTSPTMRDVIHTYTHTK